MVGTSRARRHRGSRYGLRGFAALALVALFALLVSPAARADVVYNSVMNNLADTLTVAAGGSATVSYWIEPTNNNDTYPDGNGCNATGDTPVTVTIAAPTGVSASPASVSFTGCGTGNAKSVVFSSSTAGTYTVADVSVSGGKEGSTTYPNETDFTLSVTSSGGSSAPATETCGDGIDNDNDGSVDEGCTPPAPTNTAPTSVSAGGPYSVSEGGSVTLTASASDAEGDALTYAWDLDNDGAYDDATGASTTFWATAIDGPATQPVGVQACDAALLCAASAATTITINNVAPTITSVTGGPVDEGSPATITVTATDPMDALSYEFDCDGDGTYEVGLQAANATTCATSDDDDIQVNVRVTDGDAGGTATSSHTLVISNVAPTATFGAPTTAVDEGSSFTLSFTDAADVSSVDQAEGFTYRFDCGDGAGYSTASTTSTATCSTSDNGTLTVKGKIFDKDGEGREYTGSVTVRNVAPTISSVVNNGPVNEGGSATITTTASDPAGAADPLSYALDCNNDGTYETTTTSCTFNENGSFTVGVKAADGDGGEDTDSTTVVVNNVAPGSVAATFAATSVNCGANTVSLNVSFADPGTLDTHTVTISWSDGQTDTNVPYTGAAFTHTFNSGGPYSAAVVVTDDDGGASAQTQSSNSVTVGYNVSGILAPIKADGSSIFKTGSTVPVKVEIRNCTGAIVSTLAPTISVKLVNSATPSGTDVQVVSTSAADSGTTMRFDSTSQQYIYNLSTASLNDPTATYYVTVSVPGSTPVTAKFGIKK